jgi:TonB family protein
MAVRYITVTGTRTRARSIPLGPAILLACTLAMASSMEEAFSPARLRTGDVPPLPALAVGGGEVFLELAVSREGRVTAVTPLRRTPPFTDAVLTAVREWEFSPAGEDVSRPEARGEPSSPPPVTSKVLVGGIFRPPALLGPTLGQAPEDVGTGSPETPFPLTTSIPPYPPTAYGGGTVLLEVLVDRSGTVAGVRVVRSAPPFDGAAAETVKDWKFRPARVRGQPAAVFAYIMFGFPVPVGIRREPGADGS